MSQNAEIDDLAAEVSTWLIHGDLECLGCKYNLRGLVGPTVICPECGKHNDLTDPAPWRTEALPLGVQQREHWPASAVALSLLIPIAVGVTLVASSEASALVAVIAAAITLLLLGAWVSTCQRWVGSCVSAAWGISILWRLHITTYLILLTPTLLLAAFVVPWLWCAMPLPVLAMFEFGAIRRRLSDAGQREIFRLDWEEWRLPIGDGDGG